MHSLYKNVGCYTQVQLNCFSSPQARGSKEQFRHRAGALATVLFFSDIILAKLYRPSISNTELIFCKLGCGSKIQDNNLDFYIV